MPAGSFGTARADFPGGDAGMLYRSIRRILELPAETRLFTCHDYKSAGRDYYAWESTVGEQRAKNIHVHDGIGEVDFVTMRKARDATLDMPTPFLPSVQVNMRAGRLPPTISGRHMVPEKLPPRGDRSRIRKHGALTEPAIRVGPRVRIRLAPAASLVRT